MISRSSLASTAFALTHILLLPINAETVSKPAQGNDDEELTILPELIVTASRFSQDPFLVPYTTSIISQKQMKEHSDRTIPEALKLVPGVMIQKTAVGHGSPYIRGFTGRQNLLMLDGIRLNNSTWRSGPAQYTNTVDALSLSDIELVKGQGSVLYGSDSIGGTLNLISQSAEARNYADGQFFSHGSAMYRFMTNGNSCTARIESDTGVGGEWGLHVGVTTKFFGNTRNDLGEQKHTGYDEVSYDAKGEWIINKKNTLSLTSRSNIQDDVWRTHKTIYAQPWHGTTLGSSDDYHYDQINNIQSIQLKGNDLKGAINAYALTFAFIQTKETEYNSAKSIADINKTHVDTLGITLQMESELPLGKLVYGSDYYRDWITTSREKGHKPATPTLPDGSTYDLFGLFSEYIAPFFNDKLEIRGGLRYTYAKASLGKLDKQIGDNIDKDWNNLVLGCRALYQITQEVNVYAGVSQAFRAPNIDDLGANQKPAQTETFVNGNPNLEPEQYLNYELGTHYEDNRFSANLATYFTQMRDLVTQTPIQTQNGKTQTVATNSGQGWVTGVEAYIAWEFIPQWQILASGHYIYGKADEYASSSAPIATENYLSRLSPLMGTLALRWDQSSKKYWAEARLTVADKADKLSYADERDTSRIPPGGTPGYYTVGLYAGWQISENLNWTSALENITNQTYRIHGSGQNEAGINFINSITYTW